MTGVSAVAIPEKSIKAMSATAHFMLQPPVTTLLHCISDEIVAP